MARFINGQLVPPSSFRQPQQQQQQQRALAPMGDPRYTQPPAPPAPPSDYGIGAQWQPPAPPVPQYQPQIQRPMQQQPMGDVHPAVARREFAQIESRLADALGRIEQRLANGEARIEDVIRIQQNSPLGGVGAVPQDAPRQFAEALAAGRVLPYIFSVDVLLKKGEVGMQNDGDAIITADGPVFVAQMWAYAQISASDPDAANYPASLLKKPSCDPECGDGAFSVADADATFSVSTDSLYPSMNVQGRFIPISPNNCRIITAGADVACATLTCPDDTVEKFSAVLPIVLFDHPDCIDGLVSIKTNSCDWQNVMFPLAFFDTGFDITNEVPDCIGLGGYFDCQKLIDIGLTPTVAPRFDTVVTFVLAGFRLVTCGGGACGTPVVTGPTGV